MKEIDSDYLSQKEELLKRHKDELESLHSQLNKSVPVKARPSTDLLISLISQRQMVRQKNYMEAHMEQQLIKAIQYKNQDEWNKRRSEKMVVKEAALIVKQKKEINCLKDRKSVV